MADISSTGPWGRDYAQRVVTICFSGALLEGLDIQSMGVAAPKLAPAFHLIPRQVGLALSASIFGLMIGAAIGGWLSDRLGRKPVLILSMAVLGVSSLATSTAWDATSLVGFRVLAGLGLGGVFPSLIALVSESAAPSSRASALGLMYCGMPAGGAIAGAVAASLHGSPDWRPIFYLGGFGPLLVIPAMMFGLSADRGAPTAKRRSSGPASEAMSPAEVLFGGRTGSTLLLWVSYFFTLLIVYLLLNWLPSLLVSKGYSKEAATSASMVLNFGAVVGSVLLGRLMDRGLSALTIGATYIGMVLSLASLALAQGVAVYLAAFATGLFAIGGQLVLYSMAPRYYPSAGHGTGIGAAVAVGRIGSILGPLLAGEFLGRGLGANAILEAAIPGLLVAAATALLLDRRPQAPEVRP